MGAYHFEACQADRLSSSLHLVTLDQRGTLRSAPLRDDEPLGIQDLIDDCEAVRIDLGIPQWSVIGHSFGGYLAVRYAEAHPTSVERLVLENPTLDPGSSARSLLSAAAFEYALTGDQASAYACFAIAYTADDTPAATLWNQLSTWLGGLGQRREHLYIFGENKRIVDEVMGTAPFPEEWWSRGAVHQARLISDGGIFTPLQERLSSLPQPTLLIKGRYDHVFAMDQVAAFVKAKPATQWSVYGHSGHFAHIEEPDRFAAQVGSFIHQTS